MTITGYTTTRHGNLTIVTATSDLAPPPIFYHWFLDGAFAASTQSSQYSFALDENEQARIEALDTLDPDFDPITDPSVPDTFAARWSIWWVRSTSGDVAEYRVEERVDTGGGFGAFVSIGTIVHQDERWTYQLLTGRLIDLATYEWRVIPVDLAGNDGTPITPDQEQILRIPDSPNFTIFFDIGRQRVRFDPVT